MPLRKLRATLAAAAAALLLSAGLAGTSTAAPGSSGPRELKNPAPSWMTPELEREIRAAGTRGKAGPDDVIFNSCPGAGPTVPGVQAGTCLVVPSGCTANFVYYDGPVTRDPSGRLRPSGAGGPLLPPFTSNGKNWFLGTAGHCLKGRSVLAQVRAPGVYLPDSDAGGIADIGTVHKKMDAGIGKDFGTVQIRSGFLVTPANPVGAPMGIATTCIPAPIDYYGHGYHFAVAQGKAGGGEAFFPQDSWYTWAGTSFGGDSGSGVTLPTRAAVGNLTHGAGVVDGIVPLPIGWGTRMTRILDFLGRGFYLVNADGSLSRETSACNGPGSPWDRVFR